MQADSLQPTGTLLKLLERATFVGIWTFDPAQDRIEWSDQLAAIHGAQPGYSPARGEAFALYVPEWRERISARVHACATRGEPFDEEMQIRTLQGRRTWVRSIGHAVRDREGDIVRVEGAVQEITPHGHRAGTLLRDTV
ncbi:MAG TPA: PAS domain-containing protein, partial [Ramlibacter sp.]|nr:PAS domain-containing protein [Ramlibacter sp.]